VTQSPSAEGLSTQPGEQVPSQAQPSASQPQGCCKPARACLGLRSAVRIAQRSAPPPFHAFCQRCLQPRAARPCFTSACSEFALAESSKHEAMCYQGRYRTKPVTSKKEKKRKKKRLWEQSPSPPRQPHSTGEQDAASCKQASLAPGYPRYFFYGENQAQDKPKSWLQSGKTATVLGLQSPEFIQAIPKGDFVIST